jgi:hypothetical protein
VWHIKKPKQYAYCFGLLITSKFYVFLAPYLVGIRNIVYLCTLESKEVMTRKNIISLHILPPSSMWYLGKNNFDERSPMATSVAVGM